MAGFVERNRWPILMALIGVGAVLIVSVALGSQEGKGQAQQPEVKATPQSEEGEEEFFWGDEPVFTGPPSSEDIEGVFMGEGYMMLDALRRALGEDVPCGEPCMLDNDFEDIVHIWIMRCLRLEPASYRLLPTFDLQRHGQIVGAMELACGALQSAQADLGEPRQTPEWMAAVLAAKTALVSANIPQR